jgi:hypothetical protein
MEQQRPWCLFTSAGDRNAVRQWLRNASTRKWDLVLAYYGDSDNEYSALCALSNHAYRAKGGKFQNLKKLVTSDPAFFDRYSHVWVCDDDIRMSSPQIEEAFATTDTFGFWVAQPAFTAAGKNSHPITCHAPEYDYRIVSFVETGVPIFRTGKLMEFLQVYDGSLTGAGIDNWYGNLFRSSEFGRLAIIDRVQVTNPHDEEKGGREIERLQSERERLEAWETARQRYDLVASPHKVFAYCKIEEIRDIANVPAGRPVASAPYAPPIIFSGRWNDHCAMFDPPIDLSQATLRARVLVEDGGPAALRWAFLTGSEDHVLELWAEYPVGESTMDFSCQHLSVLRGDPNLAEVTAVLLGGNPNDARVRASLTAIRDGLVRVVLPV